MGTQIIAVANQKGGVGKTTTAMNLGAALAELDRSVLLLDLDPQHSLTGAMGIESGQVTAGSQVLFRGGQPQIFRSGNLALMPTSLELSAVNFELAARVNGNTVLKKALSTYEKQFDIIIIDTPPNLDRLTLSALVAAQWVVIPCQCQYMALEGLSIFIETLQEVKELNPTVQELAIVPVAYNSSRSHEKEALEVLRERFGKLCREPVPYRTEYPNATAEHRPVVGDQFEYWKRLATYAISKFSPSGEVIKNGRQ